MNKIKVCIYTYSLNSFLDFVANNKIYIFELSKINEYEYVFYTTYKNYRIIRKYYKNCKIKYTNGVVNLILRIFSEKLVIFCLVISSIFYFYLSNIIFHIQINGTSNYLNNYLKEELQVYKITKYQFIPSISKLKEIEKEIINNNLEKFDLLSIIKKGNYIIVNYEIKKESLNLDSNKGKIYAKKDAVISKILIGSGNVLVKENQFVKSNELLVEDHIYINDEPYFIGTKGLIYGYTYNKVEYFYDQFELDKILIEGRYLISKDYQLDEKIITEEIIYHDIESKLIIIHYKCEEILNSY